MAVPTIPEHGTDDAARAAAKNSEAVIAHYRERERFRWIETLPWAVALALYFLAPNQLAMWSQVLITIIFAMSLDLVVGYAGRVTLGHAVFFGLGAYTAGILAVQGMGDPLVGLVIAALVCAVAGLLTGIVVMRVSGLAFVMLTLAILMVTHEFANRAAWLTGGADSLSGIQVTPVLGYFRFDIFGKTGYLYCLVVLFAGWCAVRKLVHSPFGRSIVGIRENVNRMRAVGAPVLSRLVVLYAISAALAGIAGALLAQTTQSVALTTMDLERSGTILVMLILGGVARLYGSFIGVPVFMVAQDSLAKQDPAYWLFWLGLTMILLVLFARGGILGIADQIANRTLEWRGRSRG